MLGRTVDMMFHEGHPENQVVKCVVVGDTGVGKTRLICSRACGTRYSLKQLMQTHVPTVWAIDHYRKDREIYDKSWCAVDNVRVSLQLWDTFGYHDKDRKFAYGKADVVLLCFSTVRPRSLKNIVRHWGPEIRSLAQGVPIILCGTQVDLRYLFMDETFRNLDKGPFYRQILEDDIVTPEMGRQAYKEMNAMEYYETSVLEEVGIQDVFENAVRVALIYKREKHFWSILNNNYKRVGRPLVQEPFLPPQPTTPQILVPPDEWELDLQKLYSDQTYCDIVFKAKHGLTFQAHKFIVATALPVLKQLLCQHVPQQSVQVSSELLPDSVQQDQATSSQFSNSKAGDKVGLLDCQEPENIENDLRPNLPDNVASSSSCASCTIFLNSPVFYSVQSETDQTIITLNDNVPPAIFQHCLQFMYTWSLDDSLPRYPDIVKQIKRVAELLAYTELIKYIDNIQNGEDYLNLNVTAASVNKHKQRMKEDWQDQALFTDVIFEVDGGHIPAHRALLMVRSDMMCCMFSNNFLESSAKVVSFPGVSKHVFSNLLHYLYTGTLIPSATSDMLELIAVANRLCLPHLQALVEDVIVTHIHTMISTDNDAFEEVLGLLEPAQLHNADQLAVWCIWYLCCNYLQLCKKCSKLKQNLKPDNQVLLSKRRWPPVWYLKALDFYERCQLDLEREKKIKRSLLCHYGNDDSADHGCLGFCSRRKRRMRYRQRVEELVTV